jgi:hypothetical protein
LLPPSSGRCPDDGEDSNVQENKRCDYESQVLSTFTEKKQCIETKDSSLVHGLLHNLVLLISAKRVYKIRVNDNYNQK